MNDRSWCSQCKRMVLAEATSCAHCRCIYFTRVEPNEDPREKMVSTLPSGWEWVMWIPRPMMQRDYDFIVKWFEVCREGLVSERASVRTYKEPQTKKEDDRE